VHHKVNVNNVTVVLSRPKYSGNVGSVARCAKNMGVEKIIVVNGQNLLEPEMLQMSTHCAADVVSQIQYFGNLGDALAPFQYIVGTTSRKGSARGPVISPRELAEQLVRLSHENEIALLFGSEDKGLANEELRYCNAIVTIPTAGDFKSINLSHAVMILCYEILTARLEKTEAFVPRMATAGEVEGMYAHLKAILTRIGFLNPENPDYWMMHIRRFLSRTKLFSREVKIIRGICRQIDWSIDNLGAGADRAKPREF
jgi:tRNA/rRNA methyltransferase